MRAQAALVCLVGLAAARPTLNATLAGRDVCPDGKFCADCYADNSCGDSAVTLGIRPDSIAVGDVLLDDLANTIAGQCYPNLEDGVSTCDPSEVRIPTMLEDGTEANVVVSITSTSFATWAENLFVASIKAAIFGTAKHTSTSDGPTDTKTFSTIPPSFFIALQSAPEDTITIGMTVEAAPEGDGTCGDILSVGAAIVGVAGPGGALAGAGITFASIFCGA